MPMVILITHKPFEIYLLVEGFLALETELPAEDTMAGRRVA